MGESTITIKFSKSELVLLNQMVGHHITDWEEKEQLPQAKYLLQKSLLEIEEDLNDKIQEAINDKRISAESNEEQTKMETRQRVCVPCDD